MTAFRLRFLRKGSGTVSYDTRFGTDSSATIIANSGWFTFGLKPGCRRIWVDSSKADDTGNGLTAATAKKTLPAAWTAFITGWTQSDQLMLAGTGGRSYSDDALGQGWDSYGGVSATYPMAILCYDPADASNTAKYGKLYGQDKPRILIPDINTVASWLAGSTRPIINSDTNSGSANFAMQGIIVDGQDLDAAATGTTGRHDNLVWQNCQFKQLLLGNNNNASGLGLSQNLNISKCSFYGMWRALNGNTSGMFTDTTDGMWVQDNVFGHCGWRMGGCRDDSTANGGTAVFGHSCYFAAGNINGHFDRNVTIDSASDGINLRGSAAATQNVSIDDAIGPSITGFSSSYLDNPGGSVVTYNDFALIGGSDMWSSAATATKGDGARGGGFGGKNSNGASTINNGVAFDNPKKSGANSRLASFDYTDVSAVHEIFNLSNIRAWNYSDVAQGAFYAGADPSALIVKMTNCLLDNLTSAGTLGAGTISGTGVRTWAGGDYPGAITKAQLITALGFSGKAAMVNAMLEYPHLPWAQVVLGQSLPAFGITPQYATVPVSTLTTALAGLPTPTVVYKTTLNDLTISTLAFNHSAASTALLSGCSANYLLTSSDLPTGFSIVGRVLSYSGSGAFASTPTIHVLETNSDGAGTHTTPFTLAIS